LTEQVKELSPERLAPTSQPHTPEIKASKLRQTEKQKKIKLAYL
jgi:hypothetical protein